jgi:hypothetical protein
MCPSPKEFPSFAVPGWLRRLVLEACGATYKSSPDTVVVKIDEEWASMVTWEYVTRMRYMVYNVAPGAT